MSMLEVERRMTRVSLNPPLFVFVLSYGDCELRNHRGNHWRVTGE